MIPLILPKLNNLKWWIMGAMLVANIVTGIAAYTYYLKLEKAELEYSAALQANQALNDSLVKQEKSCSVTEDILHSSMLDAEKRKDTLKDLLESIHDAPRSPSKGVRGSEVAGNDVLPKTALTEPSSDGFLSEHNYRLLHTAACKAKDSPDCPSTIP